VAGQCLYLTEKEDLTSFDMTLKQAFRKSRALFGSPKPLILYHKPTARCDCRCRFCNFWVGQPSEDDVLPTPTILKLLDSAYEAGMVEYTVFGGEPLLVKALSIWFQHAKELGFRNTICTSGYRLADRSQELGPYTTLLLLSLEAIGEKHDKLRGTPGLFERVTNGLDQFKRHSRAQIHLWSQMNKENQDQVEGLAEFAKANGIGVAFFPTARFPGYNDSLVLSPEERRDVFERAVALKGKGFPVKNSKYALRLMATGQPFQCNLPRLSVIVSADGKIFPCDPGFSLPFESYGSLEDVDLKELPSSEIYRRNYKHLSGCNNCLLPCVGATCDSLWKQAFLRLPFVG